MGLFLHHPALFAPGPAIAEDVAAFRVWPAHLHVPVRSLAEFNPHSCGCRPASNTPKYFPLYDVADLRHVHDAGLRYPVVVKPSPGAGSNLVKLVENETELRARTSFPTPASLLEGMAWVL